MPSFADHIFRTILVKYENATISKGATYERFCKQEL